VPVGKFDPVRVMTCTPGCPALGDAGVLNVTVDCAATQTPAAAKARHSADTSRRAS
jgi:hypothetical protein